MAISIASADSYISLHVIDIEEWVDSDLDKKTRILNVASKTLTNRFSGYTIPDNAVYEFSAKLAIVFSDTNRLQQQGVIGYSVNGVASFTFKESGVSSNANNDDLSKYIPKSAVDIINADPANDGLPNVGTRSRWTVV